MKKSFFKLFLLLLLCVSSCVGTDVLDDIIIAVRITESQSALFVDESYQLKAKMINSFGDELDGDVTWSSANSSIVSVNSEGLITGVAIGQTEIQASSFGIKSNSFLITVVQDPNAIATIQLAAPSSTVGVGGTVQFSASALTIDNQVIDNVGITWSSSDLTIATIGLNGLATGVAEGSVNITASAGGIVSKNFTLNVGSDGSRSGTFDGLNGYRVSGTSTLEINSDGDLVIHLNDDFSAQNGPGLYVYLANSKNSVSGGFEVAKLEKNSGASSYPVKDIAIDDFNFVTILCKPFNIPFGSAELN